MTKIKWSFSSLKQFTNCPRQYYEVKVQRNFEIRETEQIKYGKEVHKALEDYVRDGAPLAKNYLRFKPMVDALLQVDGDKLVEHQMALDIDKNPCDFYSPDYWVRGIADLLIINKDKHTAYLVDYKTSKNAKYADTKQLDLLAGAVFTHFPEVVIIKSALLFVVSNEMVKKEHEYIMRSSYLNCMEPELVRLEAALKNDVWNPVSGPLCKFCPVTECSHNRKG